MQLKLFYKRIDDDGKDESTSYLQKLRIFLPQIIFPTIQDVHIFREQVI